MKPEYSDKKLKLSLVLVIVFLLGSISIAMAVQLPMKQGGTSSKDDVIALQKSLDVFENNNLVDGIFEPSTGTAVKNIPSANPLTIDPGVGTQTGSQLSDAADTLTVNAAAGNGGTISPAASQQVSRGNLSAASGGGNSAGFWLNRSTWLQPLKGLQTADPYGGARYFGAPRANGRAHAAIDFIAPNGRLVYAMTDGTVQRVSLFYENTSAVEVHNTDGTIARYCEIAPSVSVNTIVHRGDVIGTIITNNDGTSMLHLEMYMGTASGSLSQSNNSNYTYVTNRDYQRRSDLIDPSGAENLPTK